MSIAAPRLDATLSQAYTVNGVEQYPAFNAIDGNLNTVCASTTNTVNAWLSVRIAVGTQVRRVDVHNRRDVYAYALGLGSFEVWVGTSAGDITSSAAVKCGGFSGDTDILGGVYPINCGGVSAGAFVTLRQVGDARYLTIAELNIFQDPGPPAAPPMPAPPPTPPLASLVKVTPIGAELSTTYHSSYPAANAVDGNLNTLVASANEAGAWLSVRLPPSTRIAFVAAYNRNDDSTYAQWLGDFEIWLGDSFGDTTSASAVRCGARTGGTTGAGAVYTFGCGGVDTLEFVTLRQLGSARHL